MINQDHTAITSTPESPGLMRTRRFLPYFATQFLGAFNDNVFKNALIILITFKLARDQNVAVLINTAAALFIVPFFLFSAIAGQLADKYDKALLIRRIKLAEIVIMVLGSMAVFSGNVNLMLLILFLMGTQSAFFGPVKYSLLPQHLYRDELLHGNALVESATFMAILLGTITGGLLAGLEPAWVYIAVAVIAVACIGWMTSCRIPSAEPSTPDLKVSYNVFTTTWEIIRFARENRTVFLSIMGISWFWLIGTVFLTQVAPYTRDVFQGDERVATLLMAMFSMGIGLGAWACEKMSGRYVEIGLVPIGALGMTLFGLHLGTLDFAATEELLGISQVLADRGRWPVLIDLVMLSFSGGLYIVPMYTLIQLRSREEHRSRIMAAANVFNAIFMVGAAVMSVLLLGSGLTIPQLFFVVALMNVAVSLFIFDLVPEYWMRLLIWLLVHSVYRIEKEDIHHIPTEGASLLVCNHVSFVDALIIGAVSPRPIRFVMHHFIYEIPVLKAIFKAGRVIPIASPRDDIELLRASYDSIDEALNNGELVCIFPEGTLTPDGEIHQFKNGMERIIKRTPVPVIPLALRGMWGTWFSRYLGRAMQGFPKRILSRVSIVSGAAVSPERATAKVMQEHVSALRGAEQ
jgi:1-acyl-sn-glycerol-3-phosphate acyltransferase